MPQRPGSLATLCFLLAVTPVRAQWRVRTIPGTEEEVFQRVAVDPTDGTILATTGNRVERIHPDTGARKVVLRVPFTRPMAGDARPGPRLLALAVRPDGSFDVSVWEQDDGRILRCWPDPAGGTLDRARRIAGKTGPRAEIFRKDSAIATTQGFLAVSLVDSPYGQVYACGSGRVFQLAPAAPFLDLFEEKDLGFGIRALAGSGPHDFKAVSIADRAGMLEAGRTDARKVPLNPTSIALTAGNQILFADSMHHRVFRLDPPAGAGRTWTLEIMAGSGKPAGDNEGNGGDHADAGEADLGSLFALAVAENGRIYAVANHRRIWEFTPYIAAGGRERWRSHLLTFAPATTPSPAGTEGKAPSPSPAGTEGKAADILPPLTTALAPMPGGGLVLAGFAPGIRILTPPQAEAGKETKRD